MTIFVTVLAAFLVSSGCATVNAGQLLVIDKEVHYVRESPSLPPRLAPIPQTSKPALAPWSSTIKVPFPWKEENLQTSNSPGFVYREPDKPWILQMAISSRFPDETPESALDYKTWYRISIDDGKTFGGWRPVIQRGKEYNQAHPIREVWIGKNGFFVVGVTPIVRASNGEIMVPIQSWPVDADGNPLNPLNAWTYMNSGVLIGRWAKGGSDIIWDAGQMVKLKAEQSARGAFEPTIIELKRKGSLIMILRASNECRALDVPGRSWVSIDTPLYKWLSFSSDYGRTWSKPAHFSYSDGKPFFSPSSCSTIIRSIKNNRLYWIGNISETRPAGNQPRYPLVIGQVDEDRKCLVKENVVMIDTRNPEYDSADLHLSNFDTYQDSRTGNILVVLRRYDYAL